ncbi:MAG: MaoC/PaaZ C-terminal domain-containing protein [Thermodesulfobacteriota bacterium]|nr:MaoC/PaaZ C-terminal domain-containing protein [Thermodesulfobacteriota bacterium]
MAKESTPRFWEDLEIGEEYTSPSRTVTEADIVNFAGLSGDYNELHTSEEFGKGTMFGTRIAHGLLGLTIASGLFTRTELCLQTAKNLIAFLGLEWKFKGPIKIGDTVTVKVKIIDKKETKNPERGIFILKRELVNQRGEVVQEGETPLMIKRKQ